MISSRLRKTGSAFGVICLTPFLMAVAQIPVGSLVNLQSVRPGCQGNDGKIILFETAPGFGYDIRNIYGIPVASGMNLRDSVIIDQLTPGEYVVKVFNNEYSETKQVPLQGAVPAEALFSANRTQIEAGEWVSFSNLSTNAGDYSWDFGDGNVYHGVQQPIHPFYHPGQFTVTLTARNKDCVATYSQVITVQERLNTAAAIAQKQPLRMYASGKQLFVEGNVGQGISVEVFNLLGQNMKKESFTLVQSNQKVDLNNLQSGYYLVRLSGAGQDQITQKIFIR